MSLPSIVAIALNRFQDPLLGKSYPELGWVRETIDRVHIRLGYPKSAPALEALQKQLQALLTEAGITLPLQVTWRVARHQVQAGVKPHPTIANVIAVGSGKGGVGKSTLSANLALALSQMGARVGLLDADIYGPSQPHIFGLQGKPFVKDNRFIPMTACGLSILSMGSLVDESQAMIWRGPMVSGALQQLFFDTAWPELDYLIVDLPPGTGDIQLTMSQKLPIAGAVVVTTPQDLSLIDARKACTMFDKVKIPVLGLVENMSTHRCSKCNHEEPIFGHAGGSKMAEEIGVPFLGSIPLTASICSQTEAKCPTVAAFPQSLDSLAFMSIADRVAALCATRPIDYQLATQSVTLHTE